MSSSSNCPDPARLRALLEGQLREPEQAELSGHLDTCVTCQQTLEGLAAGSQVWSEPARQLGSAKAKAEPALQQAMEALKAEASEAVTQPGTSEPREPALDFLSPPAQPDHLGRLGNYDVLEVIGRGGMGVVLKAFDPGLRRIVAIKVLAPHLATTELSRRRFQREGWSAAAVEHEHIVRIHAVAEAAGLPYLVMEYVPGGSLQQRLDREGPPSLEEILRIGQQTAAGLAAAHVRGLIHRDIKPANILLEAGTGWVKLTDFGLARAVDDATLTQSGVVAGTPQYMAPEQARGEALDHRADLFSLGSVLYALCTGRPPFAGGAAVAVLYKVCTEAPPPIAESNPTIPDWLDAIVAKLHAKQPADRFQSAAEVAALVGQHLGHLRRPKEVAKPRETERPPPPSPGVPTYAPGYEYRSKRTLWGWPLVHVATGIDPKTKRKRVAKGIIAVGDVAIGGLAFGGLAVGGIAAGGGAVGGLAFGGGALGLVAIGGGAIGLLLALGGIAVGSIAIGGGALGYYAFGGGAWGVHPLGGNAQDPEALRFFRWVFGSWVNSLVGGS
jgi:serine/threonine-protein kinase